MRKLQSTPIDYLVSDAITKKYEKELFTRQVSRAYGIEVTVFYSTCSYLKWKEH